MRNWVGPAAIHSAKLFVMIAIRRSARTVNYARGQ